jgi:hypothetical protein
MIESPPARSASAFNCSRSDAVNGLSPAPNDRRTACKEPHHTATPRAIGYPCLTTNVVRDYLPLSAAFLVTLVCATTAAFAVPPLVPKPFSAPVESRAPGIRPLGRGRQTCVVSSAARAIRTLKNSTSSPSEGWTLRPVFESPPPVEQERSSTARRSSRNSVAGLRRRRVSRIRDFTYCRAIRDLKTTHAQRRLSVHPRGCQIGCQKVRPRARVGMPLIGLHRVIFPMNPNQRSSFHRIGADDPSFLTERAPCTDLCDDHDLNDRSLDLG